MFYKDIYYETAGRGDTVVFLHGWGGSVASFKGTYSYMSKYCRCVNLEFPGFGRSKAPDAPLTVYDYAEITRELIVYLDCGKATLIGHSFGGRIAMILAAKYPEMIRSVVLIDAAGLKPKRSVKYFYRKLRYSFAKLLVKLKIRKKEALAKYGSPDYRALSGVMRKTFVNVIGEHLNRFADMIECPALIVWGGRDRDTPPYMARYLKRRIKGSKLTVFKEAGHYSYIDRFNECNALIRKWVLSLPAAGNQVE